jgi:hypothetical protein
VASGQRPGGHQGFIDNFIDPPAASWKALVTPPSRRERKQEIVVAEAGDRSIDELSASCGSNLIALQQLRAAHR